MSREIVEVCADWQPFEPSLLTGQLAYSDSSRGGVFSFACDKAFLTSAYLLQIDPILTLVKATRIQRFVLVTNLSRNAFETYWLKKILAEKQKPLEIAVLLRIDILRNSLKHHSIFWIFSLNRTHITQ